VILGLLDSQWYTVGVIRKKGDAPMNTRKHHKLDAGNRVKRYSQTQRADFLARVVKTIIRALIGTALTCLFSLVIFALVVKAFIASDEISFQLLNSAITLVGTALGYVLGYFLARNSNDRFDQRS
jgi:hypothetical protein